MSTYLITQSTCLMWFCYKVIIWFGHYSFNSRRLVCWCMKYQVVTENFTHRESLILNATCRCYIIGLSSYQIFLSVERVLVSVFFKLCLHLLCNHGNRINRPVDRKPYFDKENLSILSNTALCIFLEDCQSAGRTA